MIITNCKIIYLDKIEEGSVLIEDGKIKKINPEIYGDSEVFDAEGLFLAPGFIDVHIHGAGGYDTMDGTTEALNVISKSIMEHGTTSFLPTTMTVDVEEINNSARNIKGSTAKFTTMTNEILDISSIDSASVRIYNEKYNIKI